MAKCLVVAWDQVPRWVKGQKNRVKRNNIGQQWPGEGKRATTLFPPQTTSQLALLVNFFPLRFFPNVEPGPRLVLLGYVTQWILRDKETATNWDYGITCRNRDNAGNKGGWVCHFATLGRKKMRIEKGICF